MFLGVRAIFWVLKYVCASAKTSRTVVFGRFEDDKRGRVVINENVTNT